MSYVVPSVVPFPITLQDAVKAVIAQNIGIGYRPGRFIQVTREGHAENLVEVCNNLVQKGETFEALYPQIVNRPDTLTLEDLIVLSPHGREWGLDESTVEIAAARVEAWDKEVGHRRWAS